MKVQYEECYECEKLLSIETMTLAGNGYYCELCSDELATCERCETVEHEDDMMNTDMGYLCEGCTGDLQ